MSLFRKLKKEDDEFSLKKLSAFLVIYAKAKDKEKITMYIYFALSRLILRAISNFAYKTQEIKNYKILHTEEDLAGECFDVLHKCLARFHIEQKDSFHFFFYKSVNRHINRIYDKQYKKHFKVIENTDDNGYIMENAKTENTKADFTAFDLKNFSLLEKKIIRSKIRQEKVKKFIERENITSGEYFKALQSVKTKLKDIYEIR